MSLVLALLRDQLHVTIDDASKLDNVEKGGVGFERGPKAGHKYWRRVRAIVAGKLAWVYYYNTPEDKAKYLADREHKRKRDNARASLNRAEKKVAKQADEKFPPIHPPSVPATPPVAGAPAPTTPAPPTAGDNDPDAGTARLRTQFIADHPELRAKRAALEDLNEAYVQSLFGMKAPPAISGTDAVKALYGAAIVADYAARDGGEPDDLHGEKLHWLRAAEMATKLIPAHIFQAVDGQMKAIDFTLGSEDDYLSRPDKGGVLGYADPTNGRICIGADRNRLGGGPDQRALWGGLMGVHVLTHEMSHQVHFKMQKDSSASLTPGAPNWDDWNHLWETKLKPGLPASVQEAGISDYAKYNVKEAWAESFTASLMYPHTMAHQCPETYEFFRKFFGPEVCRPRITDPDEIRRLEDAVAAAPAGEEKEKLLKQLDMAEGLDRMTPDDPRLEWWKARPPSVIEKLVTAERKNAPNYHADSLTFSDPPDEDAVGKQGNADRFYEMNNAGRTVYLRIGDDGGTGGNDFDPASAATSAANVVLRPEQVKECWDEDGRPLDRQMVYWHLHQDLLHDPTEVVGEATIGKPPNEKKVTVKVSDIFEVGLKRGGSSTRDTGTEQEQAVARVLEANGIDKWMRTLTAESYRVEDETGAFGWRPATGGRGGGTASLETFDKWADFQKKKGLPADQARFDRERELYLAQRKMAPQEIDHHTYRQRSGTFNYDRIDLAGQRELDGLKTSGATTERLPDGTMVLTREQEGNRREMVERLREVQPGIELRQTRNAKGQLEGARVVVDENGVPKFTRKRWVNSNPDGTQSVFFTARGPDGQHYLEDPMWKALLTPNGEPIRSAEHLTKLCRDAATERRRVWVSVKTDRPRVRKGNRWIVAPAGDIAHYLHMQVEFDGAGQPRIIGPDWAKRLGKETPRLDHLLEDDKVLGQFRGEEARPVLPAEQIQLVPAAKHHDGPPRLGDRVVLSVEGKEMRGAGAKDKEVVAWLTRILPGKDAGVVPDPPGWDRMPDGSPNLKAKPSEVAQKLVSFKRGGMVLSEKALRTQGLLPPWYIGSATQREWFEKHYIPAYVGWNATKDAETAKEYPTQYIYAGETGGGAGRSTFTRLGEEHAKSTSRWPESTYVPQPLATQLLAYMHKDVDPRTGATITQEIRLTLPADGSLTPQSCEGLPGVEVVWDDEKAKNRALAIRVRLDSFTTFRNAVGSLSLTQEVNDSVHSNLQMHIDAAAASEEDNHVLESGLIEPNWLIDNWGVGLQKILPNGEAFEIADHQQRALMKMLDNNGRALLAHYMGTGKTVSAIAGAKMMLARPDPADPSKKHPGNPKRVLVVAPLNTVEQWRQSASDFDDGALVVGSGSNDIPVDEFIKRSEAAKGDLVVCGPEYFTLHADKLKAAGFDGLIIDEVHLGVKNEDAERNRKVKEWNPDLRMLLLLTGTPMTTSPGDMVEYIRLLSNGKQWADMTAERFTDEYLEAIPVPGEPGKYGPKIQVKAAKRGELANILRQWMDIALPKDVKGKTLPIVAMQEHQHAFMSGVQAQLYNLYMATAGSDVDAAIVAEEERGQLGPEARRAVSAAKSVVNCPAFKPGSTENEITYVAQRPNKAGKMAKQKVTFETFNPVLLMDKSRGKAAGKWPLTQELEPAQLAIYNAFFAEFFDGKTYDEVAGTKITTGAKGEGSNQYKMMVDAGWPKPVPNPDRGPLGIRARGLARPWVELQDEAIEAATLRGDIAEAGRLTAEKQAKLAHIDEALRFQRSVRTMLAENPVGDEPFEVRFAQFAADAGYDEDTAAELMQVHPLPTVLQSVVDVQTNGRTLRIDTRETVTVDGVEYQRNAWVSDKKGSLHLLYKPEDWDETTNAPRSRGGFETVRPGEVVNVNKGGLKAAGLTAPVMPKGLSKEQREDWERATADWAEPPLKYTGAPPNAKGDIPLTRLDTGETVYVPRASISAAVKSIFDPGMRAERERADVVMTMGNAKADELGQHIQRLAATGGPGPEGARQMVLFGNGILDSCRTMEAKMRTMGFRDVNECIEGSPHFDAADPDLGKQGQSPNGKYFVTYIGATYTGDRELNVSIFQKKKDGLGRDQAVSLFVHKVTKPRGLATVVDPETQQPVDVNWAVYPGDTGPCAVRPSQWSADQRATIKAQFGIVAPESFVEVKQPDGTLQALYFYGTPKSAAILRELALAPNPVKLAPEDAAAARATIAKLKADYEVEARAGVSEKPPLTAHQETVFNNCEAIICSDAAQVGMNLGNSVEMVMYDSLSSPMAEWQRITRCARMLPAAVKSKLLGAPVMEQLMVKKRDENGKVIREGGKPVMVPQVDDNGEPVMVHAFDQHGRAKYDGTGAMSKLRELEADLFAAGPRERRPGTITGLKLAAEFPNSGKDMGTETFESALARIRVGALDKAEDLARAGGAKNRKASREWEAIASKAALASNLGATACRALFEELAATPVPGGTDVLIEHGSIKYEAPEAGTYDKVQSLDAEERLRAAIAALPEADQRAIEKAGYTEGPAGATSADPVAVYLAIRAAEILDWVTANRDDVSAEMRASEGGKNVVDSDVTNRLIEMLPAEDRAILKTKKYLVNVRKLGAAGHVGQVGTYTEVDPATGDKKVIKVHTGYEQEQPVRTERNTRALGRGRNGSFETIFTDVQRGVTTVPPEGIAVTNALSYANVSRTGVQKALGFDLRKLQGALDE